MADAADLSRVVLAISAFRSDDSVIAMLRKVFADGGPFGAVIVVDSLGSGAIRTAIGDNGWPVDYRDSPENLGSAGNLARRLELAAESDLDWCCAVNHDATLELDVIRDLLDQAGAGERIGAVYPRLVLSSANGMEDRARSGLKPFSVFERSMPANREPEDVAWSSSNGALYNLAAVRAGVLPWADLWMGWEDLAHGWQLSAAGWKQLLCNGVRLEDNYEYRRIGWLGKAIYLADKPPWYAYYQLRNLLLIRARSHGRALGLGTIAMRGLVDVATILLFRGQKLERLRLLFRGVRDGLDGVWGKGPVP